MEDRDLFYVLLRNTGVERIPKYESAQKVDPEEEREREREKKKEKNLPTVLSGLEPATFRSRVRRSNH